jgi:hypothetical protein
MRMLFCGQSSHPSWASLVTIDASSALANPQPREADTFALAERRRSSIVRRESDRDEAKTETRGVQRRQDRQANSWVASLENHG